MVLKRFLIKNYDNILSNMHIKEKRMYLVFCKKIMMALNVPELFSVEKWMELWKNRREAFELINLKLDLININFYI